MRETPGTRSTPDALARIDAAVDNRCCCGCGEVLDPDGPSAWFAGQWCQQRFHRSHADMPSSAEVVEDYYSRRRAALNDRMGTHPTLNEVGRYARGFLPEETWDVAVEWS